MHAGGMQHDAARTWDAAAGAAAAAAGAEPCVRETWMSEALTEPTGWLKVRVRNTRGALVTGPAWVCVSEGEKRAPLGLQGGKHRVA